MNKKTLVCILAVLMGLTVLLPVSSAESIVTEITAQLNNSFTVIWDGEEFVPKDASGNVIAPIVYQDRVYIPLRSFGEQSGAAVSWDPATRVATITSAEVPATEPTIDTTPVVSPTSYSLIKDILPTKSGSELSYGSVDISGKRYDPVLYNSVFLETDATWQLDKRFSKLKLTVSSISSTDKAQGIYVFSDGQALYNSPQIDAGSFLKYETDISDCNQLRIVLLPTTVLIDVQVE